MTVKRHIHFIGIGGIGVSGVAQLALMRGEKVSGCDAKESDMTRRLAAAGLEIFAGHDPRHLEGVDLVVYSSAVRQDNPEMRAAQEAGIPVKRRAEFLSELMTDKEVVTIAGAHGKTTTSSLAAHLLLGCGFRPTVAVGGILRGDGDNAKLGASPYFVAEADESDGSFLCYHPTYSIITNIDHEHLDFYKTYERLLESFAVFIGQTKPRGAVFYFSGDGPLRSLVEKSGRRALSFGFSKDADFYPENIRLSSAGIAFSCLRRGAALGEISVGLMGRHNVLNVLAVVALGDEMGIDFGLTRDALRDFRGVERRFQVRYEDDAISVVDDYAHHPTEIEATLEAARHCPRSRIVVVFQPHRYSRTKLLMDRFARSFLASDHVVITDIYPAGEDPMEGVCAQALADAVRGAGQGTVGYVKKDEVLTYLKEHVRVDDLVLFLGAGDITKMSDEFARGLQKKNKVRGTA